MQLREAHDKEDDQILKNKLITLRKDKILEFLLTNKEYLDQLRGLDESSALMTKIYALEKYMMVG